MDSRVRSGWLGDIALLSQETMQRSGRGACVSEPQGAGGRPQVASLSRGQGQLKRG